MKIASLVIALLMSLSLVACGGSSAQIPEKTINTPEPKVESGTEHESNVLDDNIYKNLTNIFIDPIDEIISCDIKDATVNLWYYTWNEDVDNPIYGLKYTLFADDTLGVGILSNEDYSRNAVLTVDLYGPNEEDFSGLLSTLDWHPQSESEGEDPIGYVFTEDSIILVNDSVYYEEFDNPECEKIYELYNINAMAEVMGINIQNSLAKVSSIDDAFEIQNNLESAIYYGVRGYNNYVDINPYGVIISDYDELVTALEDPYNSPLEEVVTFIDELSEFDPSDEPYDDGSDYSSPSSSGSHHHSYFYNNLPDAVKQYIDNGYHVYMITHGVTKGYYTAQKYGDGKMFTLICSESPTASIQPEQVLISSTGNYIDGSYSVTDITDW